MATGLPEVRPGRGDRRGSLLGARRRVRVKLSDLAGDFPTYARACLKIADKSGALVPFSLNHAQRKVEEAIRKSIERGRPPRIVELKARQTGMSTDAEGRLFHGCHVFDNFTGLVIAHRRDSAKQIFRMSKRFFSNLPPAVRPRAHYFTKTEIEFGDNNSRLQVEVATEGGGRSFTAQRVHLSEYAHYPQPFETFLGVMQSVPSTPESLVIVESTPKGLNHFYDLYVQAKSGRSDFTAVFVPWFEDPGYRMPADFRPDELDEREEDLVARYGLTIEQLAWRRWCIATNFAGDPEMFDQEYPSDDQSCFLASGRRAFSKEALEYYSSLVPPAVAEDSLPRPREIEWDEQLRRPIVTEPCFAGRLRIYRDPVQRHLYIVAADPSEGDAGSDPSPIVVVDRMSLEPVAVWHGRLRPDLLARIARSLCVFYNDAHCIWESNNHGLAFQIEFEKIWDDFYMREVSADSVHKKIGSKPGFDTRTRSREFLWDMGRRFINERTVPIRDPNIVSEMWVMFYDGDRIDHEDGKTNDTLNAYLLALEAHRGGPENSLIPLTEEERDTLVEAARMRQVAASMGIEPEPEADPYAARLEMTADEIEALDERLDRAEGRLAEAMEAQA